MTEFLVAGGTLVWPILVLNAIAVVYAVIYVRSTLRRHAKIAVGATTAAGILALLSVATGLQAAISPLRGGHGGAEQLFLIGLSEALNGLDLAMAGAFVVAVLTTVGAFFKSRHVDVGPIRAPQSELATTR